MMGTRSYSAHTAEAVGLREAEAAFSAHGGFKPLKVKESQLAGSAIDY